MQSDNVQFRSIPIGNPAVVFLVILNLLLIAVLPSEGQILDNPDASSTVKKCIDYTYNMEFIQARESLHSIEIAYPGHPVPLLLKGLIVYWENFPVVASSGARNDFESALKKCIELCEEQGKPRSPEYLLTDLCARGFLLLFYSENDLSSKVIPLASSTYRHIRRAFSYRESYSDFLFFTGLYNYYRVVYPETYPVYKPLAMLFPAGSREEGLSDLSKASREGIMLRAETILFLSGIYMSFESDFRKAAEYSATLNTAYPRNFIYACQRIKSLLIDRSYIEAGSFISGVEKMSRNHLFTGYIMIYKGILTEKYYRNPEEAGRLYREGIKLISEYGSYANEHRAYALFGLSRIEKLYGGPDEHKFRKEALDMADFKNINFD